MTEILTKIDGIITPASASPPAPETVLDEFTTDQLAAHILERDGVIYDVARSYWLLNGLDLIRAKQLVGHGEFEAWCKSKLNYSKSKVEKLRRAAALFGPKLESGNLTDLPLRSLAYALSAPSLDEGIRDKFLPRALAGERVGPELRRAINKHREETTHKKQAGEASVKDERGDQGRQATARSAALALILTQFGDNLPALNALVAEAGSGNLFQLDGEREFQAMVQEITTPLEERTGIAADEVEAADVETINASADSEVEPPASSKPMITADEDYAAGPIRDERTLADMPSPVSNASPQAGTETFGDLTTIVPTFPGLQREQRSEFKWSRGKAQSRPKTGSSPAVLPGRLR